MIIGDALDHVAVLQGSPGDVEMISKFRISSWLGTRYEIAPNVTKQHQRSLYIDSGNGFVSSGNNLLAEPAFTQIYISICRH